MGAALEIVVEDVDNSTVVRCTGEIDLASKEHLRQVLESARLPITIDLSGVTFLDSSGIGVIIAALRRPGGDGALRLVAPRDNVRRVLQIVGLEYLIDTDVPQESTGGGRPMLDHPH